ncbi:protein SUPPRESSOR OF GENE SILENCING 3 homolog, partial [Bidens hawaiensis]|uniref:protein SUPPRESSOR OF GENE SILENCING 3 homolog n=1 Tax=Bidens hawaiensis TaxID=980011 RepID=UPI0040499B91
MSSNRGGSTGQSNKGKNIVGASNFDVNQLNQAVQHVNLGSNQGGGWEMLPKKKRAGAATAATKPNPWGPPGAQRTGVGVDAPVQAPYNAWAARPGAIPPPLQSGWNWNSRQPGNNINNHNNNIIIPNPQPVVEDDDQNEEIDDDDSDDDILNDEYDSDEIPKTHEERKKNRWYAAFFETLDTLTLEQINEPTRQWHCPACQNGPGAIDWYKSLLSLITHTKTKGSKRVKIHRDLAVVLEEELHIRGATINPVGESYGQWKGLNEVVKDKEIVWPPMVVIMNTQLEQDDNDKWIGMGNQELLDYFGSYAAAKTRHSYGPRGHMGMSLLIFEASAVGYTEAERLSKHFEDEGANRDTWDRRPILFYPGGKRKLYGYMATKSDMDLFNKHSHGKSKLKFEMVSYQEKVVNQLKQMN